MRQNNKGMICMECRSNDHIFRLLSDHGNSREFVCLKCRKRDSMVGVYGVDFEQRYFGSYIDGQSFEWKPEMKKENIESITLSFKDHPTAEFRRIYDENNEKIDFVMILDNREPELTDKEKMALVSLLRSLSMETWKTDPGIIERFGSREYKPELFFSCNFIDGTSFISFPAFGSADKLELVKKTIIQLIDKYSFAMPLKKYKRKLRIIELSGRSEQGEFSLQDGIRLYDTDSKQEYHIFGKRIRAGRDKECDLQLIKIRSFISRLHITFLFEDNKWLVKDEYSKNGTWLNETKLLPDNLYLLHPGDVIDLGHSVKLVFFKDKE